MPECKKCGEKFPKRLMVEGKRRDLSNRKYCLTCSPFGDHNTKQDDKDKSKIKGKVRNCTNCQKEFTGTSSRCAVCNFNIRKEKVSLKVEDIMGGFLCWHCGYSKCRRNIHFHHVNPEDKKFGLSTREFMHSWKRVFAEMQKCVLLCSNCHGEVHDDLISEDEVSNMHESNWTEINSKL